MAIEPVSPESDRSLSSAGLHVRTWAPPGNAVYGCEHVQAAFSTDSIINAMSIKNYTTLLQCLYQRPTFVSQTSLRQPYKEGDALTSLTSNYLCLQCATICNRDELDKHGKASQHCFAVDSRSGCLYCRACQDYIYDPVFERLRSQQDPINISIGRKKRKLDELTPSTDELSFININSNKAPCRAIGLRGLFNMGQTCFMSVILQSLVRNPFLRNFYLTDGHKSSECPRDDCLSCGVDELFSEFFTLDKTEGYGAVNILGRSWQHKQEFAGCKQQDAHEYFQFLVDQLHCEISADSEGIVPERCPCIIHRTYSGQLRSDVTCRSCKNVTTKEDPMMDLSLDLRMQVKKQKLDHVGSVSEARLSLHSCLRSYTSPEKLGEASYRCTNCSGSPHHVTKQLSIKRLPPVLCIQLKRFEAGFNANSISSKLSTRIDFPLQLDMTPYTTRAVHAQEFGGRDMSRNCTYDLSTVIVHIGKIDGGHYVAYCREGDQWYLFDDNRVSAVAESTVLGAEAYLLIYHIGLVA
ncbi:MAG: hypothetical protein M1817_004202 [Caeruleum heppii]|nr:MAG: hypothetical protein M1817_004202 [Caeruleum heppii]